MEKKLKYSERYSVGNLHFLISKEKLNFNPEYQRESVWTTSQKQLLIDSLFIDLDIPKIYFRRVADELHDFEVVDGQQRLRTIYDYLENKFPLSNDSDPLDGTPIAGKFYTELNVDLQMQLQNKLLDVVIMNEAYSDDDIDEMFLRLQNGTPLNAAEKRRAISGNMGSIVKDLAKNNVFNLAGFTNKRYSYEDTVAKTLHEILNGSITDIRPLSIKKTYLTNKDIKSNNKPVASLRKVYSFLQRAFKNKPSPKFKKYAFISLGYLLSDMLQDFNLGNYPEEFANCYLEFEKTRIENEELPEEQQDSKLAAFTDAARSDSIPSIRYRDDILRNMILNCIPQLALKDPTRDFTDDQRLCIYLRYDGVCAECGKKCEQDNFHADHIISHTNGGPTSILNGQVLCPECNWKKGGR